MSRRAKAIQSVREGLTKEGILTLGRIYDALLPVVEEMEGKYGVCDCDDCLDYVEDQGEVSGDMALIIDMISRAAVAVVTRKIGKAAK